MRRHGWWWLLVCAVLSACAASQPVESTEAGCEVKAKAAPLEQLCTEDSSLLALCGSQQCGLYSCGEVLKRLKAGQVIPARGVALALPGVGLGVQRYWGSAQELPGDSRPVFIIPWYSSQPQELLPSQKQQLAEAEAFRRKPHEQHHIYPQAFRQWFTEKTINIDEFTLLLEVTEHRRIHRGPDGGPWNKAWRDFITNNRGASPEEIHRHAGKLIYEFGLLGVVNPYSRRPMPSLPSRSY